jgi:hypothetical protein
MSSTEYPVPAKRSARTPPGAHDRLPSACFARLPHARYARARACAQIVRDASGVALELAQRGEVALGEVDDVDVVAHARAVVRGVVGAKDGEVRPLADGHLLDERHQVVRDALGVLADASRGMCSHRVEVAQQAHLHEGGTKAARVPVRRGQPRAATRTLSGACGARERATRLPPTPRTAVAAACAHSIGCPLWPRQ